MRLLVAGHVNWDVTMRVDRLPDPDDEATIRNRRESGGGSAANAAVALARLGVDVQLLGSVGDDDPGRQAIAELEAAGVDTAPLRIINGATTTTKYVLVDDDGEVAVLGNDGVNEAIKPETVDETLLTGVDHVHLTSQRPATAARIAALANEAGVSVSIDPGRRLGDRAYDGALSHAELCFLTDREASRALDVDPDDPQRTVAVTHGEAGATVHSPDGVVCHDGFDVTVEDTTGAGDAFAAGYLAARKDGASRKRSLTVANACGAFAVAREGARTAPTKDALDAFLDDHT